MNGIALEQALHQLAEKDDELAQRDRDIERKDAQIEELARQVEIDNANIAKLQHQLDQCLRRLYGPRSEKYDPNQLLFDSILLDNDANEIAEPPSGDENEDDKKPPKRNRHGRTPHGRMPIPDHLERREIIIDIPEEEKFCPVTGEPLILVRYETSEKIEYQPGSLFVNFYKRPIYASPDRSEGWQVGIVSAPMPDHPIEKCKGDIGLISQIIVSKYCDHLPLYRQNTIFEREEVDIPRSTQDGWLMQTYEGIVLLQNELKKTILKSDVIFTDDSPIPLLVPGRGSVQQARLWVYIRGGTGPPLAVYEFSPDRKQEHPIRFLNGYRGYMHADAYSGYDKVFEKEDVTEVGCWAHARRKFDESAGSRPREATDVLARICGLYKVEKQCRDFTPDARYEFRLQHAPEHLDGIFERIEELHVETVPSEPLRGAVTYALNQRDALRSYLADGRLEIDNNTAENAIRPLALGRKNWLFAGSERGGRATALYLSLVQSCKACDVNPWQYFNDMLRRIMSHPAGRLRELLPDRWRPLPKDANGLIIRQG